MKGELTKAQRTVLLRLTTTSPAWVSLRDDERHTGEQLLDKGFVRQKVYRMFRVTYRGRKALREAEHETD
jgi:hypothetical protein